MSKLTKELDSVWTGYEKAHNSYVLFAAVSATFFIIMAAIGHRFFQSWFIFGLNIFFLGQTVSGYMGSRRRYKDAIETQKRINDLLKENE